MISVLEYLEYSAAEHPLKTAVVDENKSYTFSELLQSSMQIGSAIAEKVKLLTPIAVFAEKGSNALCAFMGILQAGCFYSLLNPDFPDNRLKQIVSLLQPGIIITDYIHREQAESIFGSDRILMIEELLNSNINGELLSSIRKKLIDTDPMYVNFTSGSTGTPKGVLVSHRSVSDFIDVFTPLFGIDSTDIIGNQAPFDFDVSVKDIYSALKTAATLVIIPKTVFSQPVKLLDYICDNRITTMIWAVSALCLITTFHGLDYKVPETVKRILFSGEVMPYKHLKAWMEHLPEVNFVNLYGPTEITCNCTYHIIDRSRDYSEGIPIGKAFPNEDVFLLSENNTEIREPGQAGEICVRGTALALGYFADLSQTEASFPNNPLNPWYSEKIYRTGDLGKYTEDDELVFCGRTDFQIKYKGHRIELEEIERAISAIPEIERCCVIFNDAKQKLYGFYLGSIDKKHLHTRLKELLPMYMIPGALRQLKSFPLTKNGKIDRKRLMEEM